MKDLKYEHQNIFPMWGRVKINFGTGMENQIFILRTPATIKFCHCHDLEKFQGTKFFISINQIH